MISSHRGDHGSSSIFVIIAMTAILIGAGFAVDVGQYVVEARSAQNTADATVLAVATDCALKGSPIADYSPYRKSGQTITSPVCGTNEATITTTKTVDGLLLNLSAGDVARTATARWGTLSQATTIPIVIADCEFNAQILIATVDITLYLDDSKPQTGCSSLPGGFSALVNADCAVNVTAGGTVPGQPGVGELHKIIPCITNKTPPALPSVVLIPMYDSAACQAAGCNGQGPYTILGFAAFRVSGYSFNGNNYAGSLGKNCPDSSRGKYCIRGDFVEFVAAGGNPGPSTDYGTVQVYLYS